jgi:hypothetical protein
VLEKLVTLLIGKAADRLLVPRTGRQKLAGAFVKLFCSLHECEASFAVYRQYHSARLKEGRGYESELFSDVGLKWLQSVHAVEHAISRVATILDIHAPDVGAALAEYLDGESKFIFEHELSESLLDSLMVTKLVKDDLGFGMEIDDTFNNAVAKLKSFMRDDLKITPEEMLGG